MDKVIKEDKFEPQPIKVGRQILRISPQRLIELFTNNKSKRAFKFKSNLPDDSRVVGFYTEQASQSICMVIESVEFEILPEGYQLANIALEKQPTITVLELGDKNLVDDADKEKGDKKEDKKEDKKDDKAEKRKLINEEIVSVL